MPPFTRPRPSIPGRLVGTAIRLVRLLFRGTFGSVRWVGRGVGRARRSGAAGETGMMRLFDLHAASCAGDTLITIGLAGTIFFNVPLGEARSRVAVYLLVTMVPFALLAPVVGPVLDHFRHGRRYALAATMLGRAFLAWLISDYINGFGLYPAAFGVLALSRAYGVARSAAVPRLLPDGLNLSQAGARASVYGTLAGAVVAPIGLAAFWFGPQWPLRVASMIFLIGMVVALRLPPRADSDPPERVPHPLRGFRLRRRGGERILGRGEPAGRLVISTLVGSATLRAMYGFLLLYLAFAIKGGDLTTEVFGRTLTEEAALGLVGGVLATGTFLATALGTRLRIHRPAALQSSGLVVVAGLAILATLRFSLPMILLLCLATSIISGVAKLSVDASIQERVRERLRASAFAHSETVLMLAFVAGGAVGLIPLDGRIGIGALAGFGTLAAVRAVVMAGRLRGDRLSGRASTDSNPPAEFPEAEAPARNTSAGTVSPGASAGTASPNAEAKGSRSVATETSARGVPGAAGSRDVPVEAPTSPAPSGPGTRVPDDNLAPPGYHIYRPSSAARAPGAGDQGAPRDSTSPG